MKSYNVAMPFSPSDLEWWMWLLIALGCGAVCLFSIRAANFTHNRDTETLGTIAAFISGLGALGFGIIGLIRFVKWVWKG